MVSQSAESEDVCEVSISDAAWIPIQVSDALRLRPHLDLGLAKLRCIECKGPVIVHEASSNGNKRHFVHARGAGLGCSKSDPRRKRAPQIKVCSPLPRERVVRGPRCKE